MSSGFIEIMAKLVDRSLIKKVTPLAPEHLVGDLIQPGHPLFILPEIPNVVGLTFAY